MIADPLLEVCVPRHLSRLWGRSAAVRQPHRVKVGTHLPTLLGLRQGQLYVAVDSDIRLPRYIRGKRAFLSLGLIEKKEKADTVSEICAKTEKESDFKAAENSACENEENT